MDHTPLHPSKAFVSFCTFLFTVSTPLLWIFMSPQILISHKGEVLNNEGMR